MNALLASPLSLIASALSSSDTTTGSRLKDFSSGDGTEDGGVEGEVGGDEVYEAESLILQKSVRRDIDSEFAELRFYFSLTKNFLNPFSRTIDRDQAANCANTIKK